MSDLFGWNHAEFSPCRTWRYALYRRWAFDGPTMLVVMLNPSTADETTNDPTVNRIEKLARAKDFAAVTVANLFAFRTAYPRVLKQAPDPVGPNNDRWLQRLRVEHEMCIAGWGTHGSYRNRAAKVLAAGWLGDLLCFDTNGDGSPTHPLFIPDEKLYDPQPYAS
jgi:hypothetical protein